MATFSGKVVGGGLNMRTSASTNGTLILQIPNGASVSVDSSAGGNEWFRATYSGRTGYVMARYIAITAGGTAGTINTTTDPLNIRQAPLANSTVIYKAPRASTVRLLSTATVNGFYRVSSASGTGWGSASLIRIGGGGSTGTPIHQLTIQQYGSASLQGMLDTLQSQTSYSYATMDCQQAARRAYPDATYALQQGSDSMYYDSIPDTNRGLISSLTNGLQPGMLIFQQCNGGTSCSKGCGSNGLNPLRNNLPHMSHVGVVIRVDWNDGEGTALAVYQSVSKNSSPLTNSAMKALFRDDDLGGPNITSINSNWKYYGIPVPK